LERVVLALTFVLSIRAGWPAQSSAPAAPPASPACHAGVYRLADGSVAGFGISFGSCGERTINFAGVRGQAVELDIRDTSFTSGDVTLRGRLVLPAGFGQVPIIVLGHGSGRRSALAHAWQQRAFPAAGEGVFVFDKRGTGGSGGRYTQNFEVLAEDVVAAVAEARRLAGGRAGRVGLSGVSQAGWVLPPAATLTPVDFIIINSGVAGSVAEEDRNETLHALGRKGWSDEVLARARRLSEAVEVVLASRGKTGIESLKSLVTTYSAEPWFDDLAALDTPTGGMARLVQSMSLAQLRERAANTDWTDSAPWHVDSAEALRAQQAPVLWLIAADDSAGPGPETPHNLLAVRRSGLPVTILRFPGTEHGVLEYRVLPDGTRQDLRYAEGSVKAELDFAIHGRLSGSYGNSERL